MFVKFENDTSDVELVTEDARLQRRSSFDNPTYGAIEQLTQSQVSSKSKPLIIIQYIHYTGILPEITNIFLIDSTVVRNVQNNYLNDTLFL